MAFTKELLQKHRQFHWKIEKLVCDGAEISYTEQYWIQEQWNKIKFSNEMPVVLGKNSLGYVWRKPEKRWNTQCLGLYGSHNSIMFWGCICKDGVGTIADKEGYICISIRPNT